MKTTLDEFEYSKYFNYLFYIGSWSYDSKSKMRQRLYMTYKMICFFVFGLTVFLQFTDFVSVAGDMQKMTYNMSISTIVLVTAAKVLFLLRKTDPLNKLRLGLWNDYYNSDSEMAAEIKTEAIRKMRLVSKVFHICFVIFYPICMGLGFFSYLWGPRELPFPAFFPIHYDESQFGYYMAFLTEFFCGILVLLAAIETDLVFFSLVKQMSVQYKILIFEIMKLDDLYGDNEDSIKKLEINSYLRKKEAEIRLKLVLKRQITIAEYGRLFQEGFVHAFFVQILGGIILLVMNGLQVMTMTTNIDQKLIYESAYLSLIMVNLFFVCLYTTNLKTECNRVGDTSYSIAWYKMDAALQKYILMIILIAQRPPKFTAAKVIMVDLNTFIQLLRNTYSWLMLFRQLEAK